jgi:hypothetical protein
MSYRCTVKENTGQSLVEVIPNYIEHKPTSKRHVLMERVEVKLHLHVSQEV